MPRIENGENPRTGLSGLDSLKAEKIESINRETSAAILAGFDSDFDGKTLHFAYDSFDQQNFADAANAALLTTLSGSDQEVTWNAYEDGALTRLTLNVAQFLALYTGGALAHKAACMEAGGVRKAAVASASTAQDLEAI
ncbi:MAG: hypothetical protein LBO64_07215 [Desulfovibrio sp.]|jgi:hypothetical protein|nr:hypothetical protein [Desulfovibrio sp.]